MVIEKQRRNKTTTYIAAAAILLAGGVFAYMEFAPRPAVQEAPLTAEARAYIKSLKLSDVAMEAKLNYFSQKVLDIRGQIGNMGDRGLNSVELYCVFRDASGLELQRERVAIVSTRTGGLDPGQTKPFRLPFDSVPDRWNQEMPGLVIAGIEFR